MALLVRDHSLLFIMAPHTGCTSIGKALRRKLDAEWLPRKAVLDDSGKIVVRRKHSTLEELMANGVLTEEERAALTVAVGVRNPFDEQVSLWMQRHRSRRPRLREDRRRQIRGISLRPPQLDEVDFETWLRRRYVGRPWSKLLGREPHRPEDWTPGADTIIRFERIRDDFAAMLRDAGVEREIRLPHRNKTKPREKRPYQEFYTPTGRAIVEDVFADRLERWGYAFEGPPSVPDSST